jgi:hypothetical protein
MSLDCRQPIDTYAPGGKTVYKRTTRHIGAASRTYVLRYVSLGTFHDPRHSSGTDQITYKYSYCETCPPFPSANSISRYTERICDRDGQPDLALEKLPSGSELFQSKRTNINRQETFTT